MSFKVTLKKDDTYAIKLEGVRITYVAKDMREILEALIHYFMGSHSHTHEHCPICISEKELRQNE